MAEPTAETFRDPAAFQKLLADAAEGKPAEEAPAEEAVEEEAQTTEDAPAESPDADEGESAPAESDEPAPEDPPADDDEEVATKPVPPARLKKEIEKRRSAEEQAAAARAETAAARQQLADFNALLGKQLDDAKKGKADEAAADDELDKLDALDPETTGALVKTIKALKQKVGELETENKAIKSDTTVSQVEALVHRQTEQFRKDTPDYDAALAHVARAEYRKALALFDDEQIARESAKIAVGKVVQVAVSRNKNAPEAVYTLAQAYGYQKAEPKAEPAKKKEADQKTLAENRKKTESVGSLPSAAPNPLGAYATKDGFDKLRKAPGKKIDPAKFQTLLKKAKSGFAA